MNKQVRVWFGGKYMVEYMGNPNQAYVIKNHKARKDGKNEQKASNKGNRKCFNCHKGQSRVV